LLPVKLVNFIFSITYLYIHFFLLQASAYASEDGTLTEEMIDKKFRDALESHRKKVEWRAEEER
jgi:hypothetical protein